MAKDIGRLHYEPFEVEALYQFQTERQVAAGEKPVLARPAATYMRSWLGDKPWNEVCSKLGTGSNIWFIAVQDNGFICCCERDPEMVAVTDVAIWQIETDAGREAIFCQHWNGNEVVPPPEPSPEMKLRMMSPEDRFEERISDIEARLTALEKKK